MNLILILGVVLLLAMFVMLVRVQNLVDIMRGRYNKRVGSANGINAALFPVFLVLGMAGFVWISSYSTQYYLPESSSVHGHKTDYMFWQTMVIITFVFVLTHLLLFTFPFVYQFREDRKALYFPDNHKLELVWTIIPAIVLTILVIGGWKTWSEVTASAPADHVKLEIVGKQFNWIVRYPGKDNTIGRHNFRMIDAVNSLGMDFSDKACLDDFMPNEIHIPKGKPVEFTIRSRDVLHSVFAFHFRQKMDAVPGMPTSFWFTPEKTTAEMRAELNNPGFNYEIACTEVCGRGHFGMRMVIVVDEPEDYNAWLAAQEPFLKKNPDFLAKVPDNLKKLAEQIVPPAAPAADTTKAEVSQAGILN